MQQKTQGREVRIIQEEEYGHQKRKELVNKLKRQKLK